MTLALAIGRRLGSMVAVLVGVSVITFAIFFIVPGGDPAGRIAGRAADSQTIQNIREEFGLDRPLPVQYERMMHAIGDGSLISFYNRENVRDHLIRGLPVTLSLTLGAGILWLGFALVLGLLSASFVGRWPDKAFAFVALACISLPTLWVGVMAQYLLGQKAGLLPISGYVSLTSDPVGWFTHLILPWVTLSLLFIGIYSRVLRANILEVVHDDFVRTARAKGLPRVRVMVRHVLRIALLPTVTLFGLDLAAMIGGGAIVVEKIFDLHGIGAYAADSVARLDLPPIMGVTLYSATVIVIVNALVDIGQLAIDPRLRRRAVR